MMMFTLWGLSEYDKTLFDDVIVPDGIEKDLLIRNIINKSGDLYLYYQVPSRAKAQITDWFIMHYKGFKRMIEALLQEYNPLENTDRTESETINLSIVRSNQASGSDSSQASGSDSSQASGSDSSQASGVDKVENEAINKSTNEVSAFDSSDYEPHDERTDDIDEEQRTTYGRKDTSTYGRKDTNTYGRKDTNTYGRKDDMNGNNITTRTLSYHGNLGTMTNQFMLEEELRVRRYNIYDVIASMFENDLLIQIY